MGKKSRKKQMIAVSALTFFLGMILLFFTIPSKNYVNLIILVKGKENMTWNDFSRFSHNDIGSGQYVFEYPLVGGSHLYLAGSVLESKPDYIYIIERDGTKIDIR